VYVLGEPLSNIFSANSRSFDHIIPYVQVGAFDTKPGPHFFISPSASQICLFFPTCIPSVDEKKRVDNPMGMTHIRYEGTW